MFANRFATSLTTIKSLGSPRSTSAPRCSPTAPFLQARRLRSMASIFFRVQLLIRDIRATTIANTKTAPTSDNFGIGNNPFSVYPQMTANSPMPTNAVSSTRLVSLCDFSAALRPGSPKTRAMVRINSNSDDHVFGRLSTFIPNVSKEPETHQLFVIGFDRPGWREHMPQNVQRCIVTGYENQLDNAG